MSEKNREDKDKYVLRRRETFERGEYLSRDGGFQFLRRETSLEVVYEDEAVEREKLRRLRTRWIATIISACVSVLVAIWLFLYAISEHLFADWIWEKFMKGLI